MARYRCNECGEIFDSINTPCPTEGCSGGRSTYAPVTEERGRAGGRGRRQGRSGEASRLVRLGAVSASEWGRVQTGVGEFDRVTGGGLVTGSLILLAGEPGAGKSTIALQVVASLVERGHRAIYVTGEESAGQIRLRAERLKLDLDTLEVLATTSAEDVAATIRSERPEFAVIDSIQTMASDISEGVVGGNAQVRGVTALLQATAKAVGSTLIIIGHINKDAAVAGPETLQHLVDAVLMLEGDRHGFYRILRATKNRFGATDEFGLFEMREMGMVGIESAAPLLIEGGERFGRVVCPVLEGTRSVVVEVQALVGKAAYSSARRVAIGVPEKRVSMLLAVLERYADIDLSSHDVYVEISAGIVINEPAISAAICAAIASSYWSHPIDHETAVLGEVSLNGGIRPVQALTSRAKETARQGFKRLVGPLSKEKIEGIAYSGAKELRDLLSALDVLRPAGATPTEGRVASSFFRRRDGQGFVVVQRSGERDDAESV